ncbi:hypothetical protein NMY22_g17116 [Coprinellus aureogranulatus]|nr:hypothetical protein NMY22_g17116 [Coprinellus aureogranulatus]
MSPTPSKSFSIGTIPVSDLGERLTNARAIGRSTGRKTFKTDKKRNEAIWPDSIERVLLDALALYTPPPARGTRGTLQRFPKRNKLIAQHILEVTGHIRTSKQVGSRIQQLRGTCKDPELMRLLVDRRRFEGSSDSSSRSDSPALSDARSQSEEVALPSLHLMTLPPTRELLNTPMSPCSTIPPPTFSRSIYIDMTIFEDDYSHQTRTTPSLFLDLDDPVAFRNTIADYPMTLSLSEVHTSPFSTIKSFDLDCATRYRVDFTVYCNEAAVYSHSSDALTTHDCSLTSTLVPGFWPEIISNVSHTRVFTIIQAITPIDSPASAKIDLFYSIRVQYQAACESPIPSPPRNLSYDAMHEYTDFAPYTQPVSSPTDSGEYSAIPSPYATLSLLPGVTHSSASRGLIPKLCNSTSNIPIISPSEPTGPPFSPSQSVLQSHCIFSLHRSTRFQAQQGYYTRTPTILLYSIYTDVAVELPGVLLRVSLLPLWGYRYIGPSHLLRDRIRALTAEIATDFAESLAMAQGTQYTRRSYSHISTISLWYSQINSAQTYNGNPKFDVHPQRSHHWCVAIGPSVGAKYSYGHMSAQWYPRASHAPIYLAPYTAVGSVSGPRTEPRNQDSWQAGSTATRPEVCPNRNQPQAIRQVGLKQYLLRA